MNFNSVLPKILALLLFLFITVGIYYPHLFEGQSLAQHDIMQSAGANHQLKDFRAETGEEGLWLHTMFSGMPAYLAGVQYSGDYLGYAYAVVRGFMAHPVGITFVSFLSFYIMLLVFGVRHWLAVAGAILFGLNGFHIISISAGHNAKIAAAALMPLVLAGIKLSFTDKRWLGVGLTTLALGLQIRTNHPQITYYLLLIVLIYGLYELILAIKEKQFRSFIVTICGLVVAAGLAVGANAGKLYHIVEYGKYSTRGASDLKSSDGDGGLDYEYAFRFSNGITEPLVMFYPNILGGASQQSLSNDSETAAALIKAGYSRLQANETVEAMPTYWGDQPLTAPYYAGSVLLFLLIIGLIVLPKRQKIWIASFTVLGIMLSWGKNFPAFNNLLFDVLPGYNKFRSVTFTIIMPILGFNLIAFLGLEKWFSLTKDEQWKSLKLSIIIAGGIGLLLLLISGMLSYRGAVDEQLPEWLVEAIRDDRKSLFRQDVIRGLIFTLLAGGILLAAKTDRLKGQAASIVLIALVMIDMLALTHRFLNEDNFSESPSEEYFKTTAADQLILETAKPGERVLNLQNPWNEARTSYYHESIGGYHGAKMRRYQDLIDAYLYNQHNSVITKLQAGSNDFKDLQVLNMLNAKFLTFGPQKENVLQNPHAFGNAWIAASMKEVNSPQEAIDALAQTDLKTTAVINASQFQAKSGGVGSIQLIDKNPNKITYTATISSGHGLAVFSEIYYPKGWIATIDGEEAPILRANYVLRALEIPAGQHQVVFEFKPDSYSVSNSVMKICSLLVFLLFGGGVFLAIKQEK